MNTSVTQFASAEGLGSVSGAPNLPDGFADTFSSRYIQAGDVKLHAVIGGEGPALLLVHGWPESWYAWRLIMPELAKNYRVIAVDQRGMGLSDKPQGGYDTATLANDLVALMDALGEDRFAIAGHDTGLAISYALLADHPERVERAALLEIPGAPGTTPAPPFFVPAPVNNKLWHLSFNRVEDLAEKLIEGREDVFYGYEFEVQGGNLPSEVTDYYIAMLSNPDSLRGGLGFYRAFDATLAQNGERATRKLSTPLLGIGGERSYGDHVGEALQAVAENVETVVITGAGHWVAEEAPDQVLAAMTAFLAPIRDGRAMSNAS